MNEGEIHHSVRIVLLNKNNELLLMKAEDPSTTETDGTYNGPFWFLVGGEIESGEGVEQAAIRELDEETGLKATEVTFGPIIWFGEFDLILSGKQRHMKQKFILAHTTENEINLSGLTESERKVVKCIEWFSLERMRACNDIVYPIGLDEYLEPILANKIPTKPIEIVLDRKPLKHKKSIT
ncbi:MAG: NUDIX domain-containing protein [Deltaproteobacteria bacterium]|nr:NUDIX domain-containing protein [Deltaproteobacteria bacterium]